MERKPILIVGGASVALVARALSGLDGHRLLVIIGDDIAPRESVVLRPLTLPDLPTCDVWRDPKPWIARKSHPTSPRKGKGRAR